MEPTFSGLFSSKRGDEYFASEEKANGTMKNAADKIRQAAMSGNQFMTQMLPNMSGGGGGVGSVPSRQWFEPEALLTNINIPRDRKEINRWSRIMFKLDPVVGPTLETHSELTWGKAEIECEDHVIKRHYEMMFDKTRFFDMMPKMDLEFMISGEVFPWTYWDEDLMMWSYIIIHDPNFMEVSDSVFAGNEPILEIVPDNALRTQLLGSDWKAQQLRRQVPDDILSYVAAGRNIPVSNMNMTHICRKLKPSDIRGTPITMRVFPLFIYENKLKEADITIADNFIYPRYIYKLGDPNTGWIPPSSQRDYFQSMLERARFDPFFEIVYHYGLSVETLSGAQSLLQVDAKYEMIEKSKMMALGMTKELLTGESTFASANAGLNIMLMRWLTKRQMWESTWIYPKFIRPVAEKCGFYKTSKAELNGHYRIKKKPEERELILPKLSWHKKLIAQPDRDYIESIRFLMENKLISKTTFAKEVGFHYDKELEIQKRDKELEDEFMPQQAQEQGQPQQGQAPVFGTIASALRKIMGSDKKAKEELKTVIDKLPDSEFEKLKAEAESDSFFREMSAVNTSKKKDLKTRVNFLQNVDLKGISKDTIHEREHEAGCDCGCEKIAADGSDEWHARLENSKKLPQQFKDNLLSLENKLVENYDQQTDDFIAEIESFIDKEQSISSNNFESLLRKTFDNINEKYKETIDNHKEEIYDSAKTFSYNKTGYLRFKIKHAAYLVEDEYKDYKYKYSAGTFKDQAVLDQITRTHLNNVTSVNDEIKSHIKEVLTRPDADGRTMADLVNEIVKKQREKLDTQGDKNAVRMLVKDLYQKQKYKIQRIVRTESVNAFARTSLLGYKEQGLTHVKWQSQNDNKVCKICRNLHGKVYSIDELLRSQYPQTEKSHIQCRCFFIPERGHTDLSYDGFLRSLEKTPKNIFPTVNVEYEGEEVPVTTETKAVNVPPEQKQYIQEIAKEFKEKKLFDIPNIEFVDDVSQNNEWKDSLTRKFQIVGYEEDEAKVKTETHANNFKNQITSYMTEDGKILVSKFSHNPVSEILRQIASRMWDTGKDKSLKSKVQNLYNDKLAILKEFHEVYHDQMNLKNIRELNDLDVLQFGLGNYSISDFYKVMKKDRFNEEIERLKHKNPKLADDLEKINIVRMLGVKWDQNGNTMMDSPLNLDAHEFTDLTSKKSARQYFINSLRDYFSNPVLLESDSEMFNILKGKIGKDYLSQGGFN